MLTKPQVQACLEGERPPHVPAWLFWMDGQFVEKNGTHVDRMRKRFSPPWSNVLRLLEQQRDRIDRRYLSLNTSRRN